MKQQAVGGLVLNSIAILVNACASVLIIMVNKHLMAPSGLGFSFAVTLSGIHFLTSTLAMHIARLLGYMAPAPAVPLKDLTRLVVSHSLCVLTMNLSLMMNTVGFYQMAKLLIIPYTCLVEYLWLSQVFPAPVILSIAVVVGGVGVVTVTDLSVTFPGFVVAAMSVLTTGTMQITCNSIQKKHGISSASLLLKAGLPMGLLLLATGPFIDKIVGGKWVFFYSPSLFSINLVLLSSLVAVLVNLSAFFCLGKFSAVTFQVTGHVKTLLVLSGGYLLFNEVLIAKQCVGMLLAVMGMLSYGYFKSAPEAKPLNTIQEVNIRTIHLTPSTGLLTQSGS